MKIQISLCAKDLPEAASYVAVVVAEDGTTMTTLGKTEASTDTTHPEWSQMVNPPADVDLSDDTMLLVKVLPASAASNTDDDSKVVASARFGPLKTLMDSYYRAAASFTLQQADGGAKIALHVEGPPRNGTLHVQLAASDLPNTDFGGVFRQATQKTDPFFELYSAVSGTRLLRSNVVEDNVNPVWDPLTLDLDVLCGSKLDTPIRLTVSDKDAGEKTQYLGQVLLTVNQMLGKGDGVLKHYPLIKGGTATAQGSVSVKSASLGLATYASRQAHKHLQIVLTALDAQRGALLDDVTAKQQAAASAAQAADAAAAAVQALQGPLEAAAAAQRTMQDQLTAMQQEFAALQAKAASTPYTGSLVLQMSAKELPDTDFGARNKTDPVFELLVAGGGSNSKVVARSNVVEDNLNPTWDPVTLDVSQLWTPGGTLATAVVKMVVYDKDGGENQSALGSVDLSVQEILDLAQKGGSSSSTGRPLSGGKGQVFIQSATLWENFVDHAAAAQDFGTSASMEALLAEHAAATAAFEKARADWEQAQTSAALTLEAAQKAQEEAEAAQLALDLMEKAAMA